MFPNREAFGCCAFRAKGLVWVWYVGLRGLGVYYRDLNNYQFYFGAPYCSYSIMGPKTLYILLIMAPILGV